MNKVVLFLLCNIKWIFKRLFLVVKYLYSIILVRYLLLVILFYFFELIKKEENL